MVSVIYLLNAMDLGKRDAFIQQIPIGEKWVFINGKKQRILDNDMVDLSDCLNGWTRIVDTFGCVVTHLSNFHSEDPFKFLKDSDKGIINQITTMEQNP